MPTADGQPFPNAIVQCNSINKVPSSRDLSLSAPVPMPWPLQPPPDGLPRFVVVIASIMALNPIAMDMMLPALPDIAATFHIRRPPAEMVLSIFLLGFGVGQFVMGPLSDRFGRRPLLLGGMTIYCIAACLRSRHLPLKPAAARALQGLGTSAPA